MTLRLISLLHSIGGCAYLAKDCVRELFSKPFYFRLVTAQVYQIGAQSTPLVLTVALCVGMVMALQFGIGVEKFGGTLYIPKLVTVSTIRELGPVFAGLMFAARVGAGITSEIASMVVTQQIDAIRALGTSPIKKIVIPRVLACLIALPLLTVLANVIGIFGGLVVGVYDLGLDASFYFQKIRSAAELKDYFSGFGKTFAFALFVSLPACYFGLTSRNGTQGVGRATTRSVVISCILILVGDYFLTKFFWIFESWK